MNLYFFVEGRRTERKVYRAWIQHVFPELKESDRIEDVKKNNFFIISGGGYPAYKDRIPNSITDIQTHGNIDYFFVCIDAEEDDPDEKLNEIENIITEQAQIPQHAVIVANCCIETWFLGNTAMMKKTPENVKLREFRQFYDVSVQDPENMGCPSDYVFKAHFHEDYLKEMFREKRLSYSKEHPGAVLDKSYFSALANRYKQTGHIRSFGKLCDIFHSLLLVYHAVEESA